MNEFTKAQVIEHAQLVARGVKPCSVLPVKHLDAAYYLELAKNQHSKAFIRETDDELWCELWIYKHDEVRVLVDYLPIKPETKMDHLILGVIFGYSLESILEYIKKL